MQLPVNVTCTDKANNYAGNGINYERKIELSIINQCQLEEYGDRPLSKKMSKIVSRTRMMRDSRENLSLYYLRTCLVYYNCATNSAVTF